MLLLNLEKAYHTITKEGHQVQNSWLYVGPMAIFVNKVLLEHSHSNLFIHHLGLVSCYNDRGEYWNRDYKAHQA